MTCHVENRYAFGKMWCVAVRDCDGVEVSSLQDCADMQYKINQGYFACDTPCATPLSISNITVTNLGQGTSGRYQLEIKVTASGTGTYTVYLNNEPIFPNNSVTAGSGTTYTHTFFIDPGTYQICAEVV